MAYPAECDPESCDCEALGFRKQGTHIIEALRRPAGTYVVGPGTYTYTPEADSDTHPCPGPDDYPAKP